MLTVTSHSEKKDSTGYVYKQIVMFTENAEARSFTSTLTMTTIFIWTQVFQLTKPEALLPYVQQIIKINKIHKKKNADKQPTFSQRTNKEPTHK